MVPKLVAEDIPLLHSLLSDVFPGVQYTQAEMKGLRKELAKVCQEMYLTYGEGDEMGCSWVEKVRNSPSDRLPENHLKGRLQKVLDRAHVSILERAQLHKPVQQKTPLDKFDISSCIVILTYYSYSVL